MFLFCPNIHVLSMGQIAGASGGHIYALKMRGVRADM